MAKTIAIAGAGNVAKYLVEELLKTDHKIVVLSRAPRDWLNGKNLEFRVCDYSLDSLTASLADVDILYSLMHDNSEFFKLAHFNMLEACKRSPKCKRFVPSECGGDIEEFPQHPEFYVPTHVPVREALQAQHEVEWTLFNIGWFMDYFLPSGSTYMTNLGNVWPLDVEQRTIRVPGTGNEKVTFTAARDAAKALARLADLESWEPYIYVKGETTTWNEVIQKVESIHGIKLAITRRSLAELEEDRRRHASDTDPTQLWLAFMDLWNATGASAVPEPKTEQQRQKYFPDITFRTIEQLIKDAAELPGTVV